MMGVKRENSYGVQKAKAGFNCITLWSDLDIGRQATLIKRFKASHLSDSPNKDQWLRFLNQELCLKS